MAFFGKRQNQHTLPRDIVSMMERFGRYEYNPQGSSEDAGDIGQLFIQLSPFAQADPSGFLTALAEAVLPVGGWAVYGAERMMWELLSSPPREHPAYTAIMDASIAFLRANGVSPMQVTGYEWQHWIAGGGTNAKWLPLRPMPTPEQAPITSLGPGETRRVAQLTSKPDSNAILVRQNADGRFCALIDARRSDEDPRRVQNEWKYASSLPEIYREIGMSLQTPPYWCDRELEPYFPLPQPQI